jgi:polysaccharide biosynthesis protein PslH
MRILVVMTHYPFPPSTGSTIVAYHSMKYLSKQHSIDLICLQPSNAEVPSAEFIDRLELISQGEFSKFSIWMRYLSGVLAGVPYSVSAVASRQMEEKVKDLIENTKYAAVLLFEMTAIQYCPPNCYRKLIVNIEDPLSIKLSRMAMLPVYSLWQRAKLLVLAGLTAKYESSLLSKLAKVLLLSVSDMHDMHEQAEYQNLSYMPYGAELIDKKDIADYDSRDKAIVFSGNMYHLPNVDGLLFFLRDIFPLILQTYPSALLWIVGANPHARIYEAALKFGKQVVITGRVDDISSYIKRASVSVCPVRLKIGVQTKILEALSCGTPVVTTSAGNSGIGGLSGTHLWIADEPLQFAMKVVDLLSGRGWEAMSNEGRRLVEEHFSWEGSAAQLEQLLNALPETH